MRPVTFRFLHAGDLHLDEPFVGVSATAPEVAGVLRDASLGALDALVRLAIARDVAFVVLSGGLYGGARHGVRAQLALLDALRELSARGIRTFVALGDEDPLDEGWTAVREWPELVTVFPSESPGRVTVERDGVPLATVHGISHSVRSTGDDLASRLARTDDPGIHVAVVHATVGGEVAPVSLDTLAGSGIDYWALGHEHGFRVVHREPWIVHAGTTQARRAAAHELGPKGAVLVEVDESGTIAEPELVSLERVRFDHVEFPIDGIADLAILRDRLVDLGRARLAAADGPSVVLGVELVGVGPVHDELHRPGAVVELVEALRAESVSEPPLLWWDRVVVATRSVRDVDDLQGRNDFVADLIDEASRLLDDDAARAARVEDWGEELPSDLAHLLGDHLPDATDPGRWLLAQQLAIELVVGDES
jgi:exonuclease SbcD